MWNLVEQRNPDGRIDAAIQNCDPDACCCIATGGEVVIGEGHVIHGTHRVVQGGLQREVGIDGDYVGVGFQIRKGFRCDVVVSYWNVFEGRSNAAIAIGDSSMVLFCRLAGVLDQDLD